MGYTNPISYPSGTSVFIFKDGSKHIQYLVSYQDDGQDKLDYDDVWLDKDGRVVKIRTHDGIFWEDADWVSAG